MNCSQPVIVDESRVLLSSSPGPGAALLEITKTGDTYAAHPVWQNNRMKNKFNSSVLYEGFLYGFDDAILACIDVKTGELKWKGGRYGYGQLLLAGGYLVVITEQGDVVLVAATCYRNNAFLQVSHLKHSRFLKKFYYHAAMAAAAASDWRGTRCARRVITAEKYTGMAAACRGAAANGAGSAPVTLYACHNAARGGNAATHA